MRLGSKAGGDGRAAGRQFIKHGNVQVAIKSERERAWNRRGGDDQDVRRMTTRSGFVHETFALHHAEAMLLVNGDEAETREGDIVFDERMSADDEMGLAGRDTLNRRSLVGMLHPGDEQLDAIAGAFEDAPGAEEMLDGEDFSGGHKRGLRFVFDGDDRGLQRDNGFAAANVALQETIHGHGLFEVGGDLGEDAFLRVGGLEGQHTLQSFADGIFANAEGDGVFLASELAVERHAELIEKKLLEDQALLGGRAKSIERFEILAGWGKVRTNDGIAPRGKMVTSQQ